MVIELIAIKIYVNAESGNTGRGDPIHEWQDLLPLSSPKSWSILKPSMI